MLRLLLSLALALGLSGPGFAQVRFSVEYSESAALFSLMDNTSGWWPGFVDENYRVAWQKKFGWSEDDQKWADRYSEYRNRTYVDESQGSALEDSPDGLFSYSTSNTEAADPLAAHMLGSGSVAEAMSKLDTIATLEDAQMLRGFYAHFRPKWEVILSDTDQLVRHADRLNVQLNAPAITKFLDRVSAFYGVEVDGVFRVFFTRYPMSERSRAEVVAGQNFLLHAPEEWPYEAGEWDTIAMHEMVHFISARQSSEQKLSLTQRFLKRCPLPAGARRLWMIEEPLAVAIGQAAYSEMVLGKPLDPHTNWYGTPWIDLVSRTLASSTIGALKSDKTLVKSRLVEEAADRCRGLTAVASRLQAAEGR